MVITAWLMLVPLKLYFEKDILVSPYRLTIAILIPFLIGVRAVKKKSLDFVGTIVAFAVGFILTMSNYGFITMLLAFYLTSTKLTRFRADIKSNQDAESEKKPRSTANVICNSAPAVLFSILYIVEAGCSETHVDLSPSPSFTSSWLSVAVLGSLSSCCADTWASEIGSAMKRGTTRLITTGKLVPAGTNGGITVIGILASLAGGLLMGLVFALTLAICTPKHIFQTSLLITGMICGLIGSVTDSIMGATLQYSGFDTETKKIVGKPGKNVKHITGDYILSNHSVNLFSAFFTTLIAPFIHYKLQSLGLYNGYFL